MINNAISDYFQVLGSSKVKPDPPVHTQTREKCELGRYECNIHTFKPSISEQADVLLCPHSERIDPFAEEYEDVAFTTEELRPVSEAAYFKHVTKRFKPSPLLEESIRNLESLPRYETGVYFGLLQPLKGWFHFLFEMLTRCGLGAEHWAGRRDLNFVFNTFTFDAPFTPKSTQDFLGNPQFAPHRESLEGAGIRLDQVLFIEKPTRFDRLTIPSLASILSPKDLYVSEESSHFLKSFNLAMRSKSSLKEAPEKIYLSRLSTTTPTKGRFCSNEDEVENIFKNLGFYILRPEDLSNEYDKHQLLSNCSVIAGFGGSGLLQSIFMPAGAKVLVLFHEDHPVTLIHQLLVGAAADHKTYSYILRSSDDEKIAAMGSGFFGRWFGKLDTQPKQQKKNDDQSGSDFAIHTPSLVKYLKKIKI